MRHANAGRYARNPLDRQTIRQAVGDLNAGIIRARAVVSLAIFAIKIVFAYLSFDLMASSSLPTPAPTATSGLVPARWTDLVLFVARVVIGLMFASHGAQKLLGWFGGMPGSGATVPVLSLPGIAGVLELVGGVLLAIGLSTRAVAFVLAGEMAVAYFMAHAIQGMHPLVNHGEPAVLYCFFFLVLWAVGPGAYSLDGRRGLVRG